MAGAPRLYHENAEPTVRRQAIGEYGTRGTRADYDEIIDIGIHRDILPPIEPRPTLEHAVASRQAPEVSILGLARDITHPRMARLLLIRFLVSVGNLGFRRHAKFSNARGVPNDVVSSRFENGGFPV